jgi:hypothetical protein
MLNERVEEISAFCLNVSSYIGKTTHTNAKTDIRLSLVCSVEVFGWMGTYCTYWHIDAYPYVTCAR